MKTRWLVRIVMLALILSTPMGLRARVSAGTQSNTCCNGASSCCEQTCSDFCWPWNAVVACCHCRSCRCLCVNDPFIYDTDPIGPEACAPCEEGVSCGCFGDAMCYPDEICPQS